MAKLKQLVTVGLLTLVAAVALSTPVSADAAQKKKRSTAERAPSTSSVIGRRTAANVVDLPLPVAPTSAPSARTICATAPTTFSSPKRSSRPRSRTRAKNAARFGFVNYVFEPWHWEWVGAPVQQSDFSDRLSVSARARMR